MTSVAEPLILRAWGRDSLLPFAARFSCCCLRRHSVCGDCDSLPIDLDPSGPYLAANLRFIATFLGLSVRYERYLAGDLVHTFGVGLEVGIWAEALGMRSVTRPKWDVDQP